MKVIDYKKVKLPNIKYHEPVKTAGGCLISRTFYKHLEEEIPIYIQTPRLTVNSDLDILDSKTYLELELDKKHINFYEFINNIDDQNIKETFKNSEDWFQEKLPMDVVDDFYKTNIKMRKYNKSPIIKFKIPLYKNNTRKSCDIFGDDLKPIEVNEIKKKTEVICILELEGIKFFKQRFETDWKVVQVRVYKSKDEPIPCLINESFLSDNEDSQPHDPFPEDGISLNSSITSDIVENDSLAKKEEEIEEEIKNISINVNTEPKTKNKSVNVEKVEENISLEIRPNKETENMEPNEESKNIDIIESNLDNEKDLENQNNHNTNNRDTEENNSINSENDNYSLESDLEDEDDDDLQNENPLDNYFSDNFTDEEEICDGLENNLEVVSFIPEPQNQESDNESESDNDIETTHGLEKKKVISQTDEEVINLDKNEKVGHSGETELAEEDYQNKSIQELIDQIEKFKKLALDRENEMSELKSKYRNLYSELNL